MGVPENIDALLVKFDINQDGLARIADVAPSAVSRWRKGAMPRMSAIKRICDEFNLTEDDILSDVAGLAAKEHNRAMGICEKQSPRLNRGRLICRCSEECMPAMPKSRRCWMSGFPSPMKSGNSIPTAISSK